MPAWLVPVLDICVPIVVFAICLFVYRHKKARKSVD